MIDFSNLTENGKCLYEQLRQFRLSLAAEESVPPYRILTNKSLVDLCARMPDSVEEMRKVFGIGKQKIEKYGQRFVDELMRYRQLHPSFGPEDMVVDSLSADTEAGTSEKCCPDGSGPTDMERHLQKSSATYEQKADFLLTGRQAAEVGLTERCTLSPFLRKMNAARDLVSRKGLTYRMINQFLEEQELIYYEAVNEKNLKRVSEKGRICGMMEEERTIADGSTYLSISYPRLVQQMILEHWTQNEDTQVDETASAESGTSAQG